MECGWLLAGDLNLADARRQIAHVNAESSECAFGSIRHLSMFSREQK